MILQFDDAHVLAGARLRDPEYLTLIYGTDHEVVLDCKAGASMDPVDLSSLGCARWEAVLVPDQAGTKELWSSKDITIDSSTISFPVKLLTSTCFAYIEGRARTDALMIIRGYVNSLQSSLRVTIQLPVILMSNPMAEPSFDAPLAIQARNEAVKAAAKVEELHNTFHYDADRIQEYSTLAEEASAKALTASANAEADALQAKSDRLLADQYCQQAKGHADQATLEATNTSSNAKAVAEYMNLVSELRDQSVAAAQVASSSSIEAKASRDTAVSSAEIASSKSAAAMEASIKITADLESATSLLETTQAMAENISTKLDNTQEALEASKVLKDQCQELKDRMEILKGDVIALVSLPVGHAYNVGVYEKDNNVYVSFADPADTVYETGVVISRWERTRLIVKTGGFPENETDGTILLDNIERGKYRETPFVAQMGVASNYYFALFTRSTSGIWNTDDTAPRFQITYASFATLVQMFRAGISLSNVGLEVGGVVNLPYSSRFSSSRLMLLDENYRGCGFVNPSTTHGLVFMPQYLLSEGDNKKAITVSFDRPELTYAITDDEVFVSGKIYYILQEAAYVALTEGTDWNAGGNILEWGAEHAQDVYTKNNDQRKSNGYGNWRYSNIRAWLNAEGTNWWNPTNIYDNPPLFTQQPHLNTGFLSGLLPAFRELVVPVYNTTARNTVATANGGDGGGYDRTEDLVWLLSVTEFDGSSPSSGIYDGMKMEYYKSVATDNASRIFYDEGGVSYNTWLRSVSSANTDNVAFVTPSGSSDINLANTACGCSPVFCLA